MLVPERNQHFERREAMTSLRPVAQDVSTMFKMVFDASTRQMEASFEERASLSAKIDVDAHEECDLALDHAAPFPANPADATHARILP